MAVVFPTIGHWYRRSNGNFFEVVAIDTDDGTVEIQFFDGTIDELELENWRTMLVQQASAPEDWSGSVDMDPEDFLGRDSGEMPLGFHDPLIFIDKS